MKSEERLKEIKERDVSFLQGTKLENDWHWLIMQLEKWKALCNANVKEVERLTGILEDRNIPVNPCVDCGYEEKNPGLDVCGDCYHKRIWS